MTYGLLSRNRNAAAAGRRSPLAMPVALGLLVLGGCALLLVGVSAPESVASLAERVLGTNGSLTSRGKDRAAELLWVAAGSCIVWGFAGLAWHRDVRGRLRSVLLSDPLPGPSPKHVLVASTLLGVGILFLYDAHRRLELPVLHWLFLKEGPLEQLTAVLYGMASALMAVVAHRLAFRRPAQGSTLSDRSRRGLSLWAGAVALAFFGIAMEEISWGQQIFGFATASEFGQANTQGETNLHNLLPQGELDAYTRRAALAVFASLVFGWGVLVATARPLLQFLLPHASLLPLAYLTYVVAPQTHLEILEIMSGVFAAFFVWRTLQCVRTFGKTGRADRPAI